MLQPLEHYTDRRLNVLTVYPRSNGANCRNGYGREVVRHWGSSCAYCGRELLQNYESWLHLSIDHVVPNCALSRWGQDCRRWVESRANIVPCCRACNEFLNGYRVLKDAPADDAAFLKLRNEVLQEKREKALMRHEQEKAFFEQLRDQPRTGAGLAAPGADAITQRVLRSRTARLTSDAIFRS